MTGLLGGGHAIYWDAAAAYGAESRLLLRRAERHGRRAARAPGALRRGARPLRGRAGVVRRAGRAGGARPALARVRSAALAPTSARRRCGSRARACRCRRRTSPACAMLEPVMTMREGARIYAPERAAARAPASGSSSRARRGARARRARRARRASTTARSAESLLALLEERDGLVTRDDLRDYEARWSEPAEVAYAGTRFLTRGGLARRRAGARAAPGAARRGRRGRWRCSTRSADVPPAGEHTTNLVTVDADGSACVLTTSLGLGSGDWLPGLDLHLNSMLGEVDLVVAPLEPGRRMESMMAPSVALDGDGPALAIGAAGGTRLRTALVGGRRRDPRRGPRPSGRRRPAARAPRRDVVNAEPGVDEGALAELERRGLTVRRWAVAPPLLRRRQPRRRATERPPTPGEVEPRAASSSGRPLGPLRLLDVAGDLVDQILLGREHPLVAEPPPELDDEALAVQVAGEAEQERLDRAARRRRSAGSSRSRSQPGGRPRSRRRSRARGTSSVGLDREVRRREAERPAARVALDDDPVDLGRTAEQPRGASSISPSCSSRRIVDDETPSSSGTDRTSKPSRAADRGRRSRLWPKRKSSPGDDHARRRSRRDTRARTPPARCAGARARTRRRASPRRPSSASSSSRRSSVVSSSTP